MAIKDEISRLQQAKQDFKEKLIEKGVTVSDEELISDYPPKLDLIKGGTDTTDATATANEIRKGFTAYIASGKVEGAIEDYDGAFEGGIEISGGGISIPSVTDLTCDSEGNVSWTAPNFDSLASYNPTISYVVSVNDNELETSNTGVNVESLLVEGTNTITVKVKAILIENGINTSVEYSKPAIYVSLANATFPYGIGNVATEIIEDNVYIFGGYSLENKKRTDKIYKYNISEDKLNLLTVKFPKLIQQTNACRYGTDIFIVGGYSSGFLNSIYKFDTISETITLMTATLTHNPTETFVGKINEYIYIVGGNGSEQIGRYDPVSDTYTTLSLVLPVKISPSSSVLIDNIIYIFGGYTKTNGYFNTIYKVDILNNEISLLDTTFEFGINDSEAVSYGKNAYIFGGNVNDGNSTYNNKNIYKFNVESNELIMLPNIELIGATKNFASGSIVYGDKAYIFGGKTDDYQKTIQIINDLS